MDIIEELKCLTSRLDKREIDYALCGGLALAVYAKPRATLDIDIMIDADSLSRTKAAVRELGFTLSAAPMTFHDDAVVIHRLTKIDETSGEHLVLDLLQITPDIQKAWEERAVVEWEGGLLKVLSPKGLILLKSLRGSGQDQDDIQYLRSLDDED